MPVPLWKPVIFAGQKRWTDMARRIKLVVHKDYLSIAAEKKQIFEKQYGVQLSLVGIDHPSKASAEELERKFADAEIALLDSPDFPTVAKYLPSCMRWLQSTFAGINDLKLLDGESRGRLEKKILTRAGGVFPTQMADYVVGAVVSMERNFPTAIARQLQKEWNKADVKSFRTLSTLSIGILGLGEIGKQVAKACNSLGMTVYGLKNTPITLGYVEKAFGRDQLSEFLQSCDYVCNVLPSTPETKDLLSGDKLKVCAKRRPGFINMGRGDIISEESLIMALNNGWISKAFLDVFEKEPLPTSSPLWLMNNVTITPHVAGTGLHNLVVELFYKNLSRYIKGEEMEYVYDWERGY